MLLCICRSKELIDENTTAPPTLRKRVLSQFCLFGKDVKTKCSVDSAAFHHAQNR